MKLVHQMKMGSEGVSEKEEGSVEGKGEASRATEPVASSQGGEESVLLVQRRDQCSSQEVVSGNSIFGIFKNKIPRKNTPTKRLVSQSLMKSEEVSEKEGRYVNTMAEDTRDEETMSKGKAAETLYESTRSYCPQDCKILAVTTGTWSDHWTFFPFFSLKNDFLEEKY